MACLPMQPQQQQKRVQIILWQFAVVLMLELNWLQLLLDTTA